MQGDQACFGTSETRHELWDKHLINFLQRAQSLQEPRTDSCVSLGKGLLFLFSPGSHSPARTLLGRTVDPTRGD